MRDTFSREEILQAIALRPCHVTGMHDPSHTTRYVCSLQETDAFERLLDLLEIKVEDLPHELHPDCGWCHNDGDYGSNTEKYKEKLRELHRWAGAPISRKLAKKGIKE